MSISHALMGLDFEKEVIMLSLDNNNIFFSLYFLFLTLLKSETKDFTSLLFSLYHNVFITFLFK